jgi:hypothetical protein
MATLIPILCFGLLIGWRYQLLQSWREAVLSAALLWGIMVVLLTESLSSLQGLTFWGALGAWTIVFMVLVIVFFRQGKLRLFTPFVFWQALSWQEKIWLLGIVLVIGVTGMIALAAPPNTWDAVSYHLTRVVFWEQYHTIAPYPTHTDRQIYQPPFAEFIILHLQLLSGSDALANMGQWAALILTSIGVSAIAKQLGANRFGQMFSAVLCVTLPIGILQATGAKNDFIMAFWVVCLAYFVIKATQHFSISAVSGQRSAIDQNIQHLGLGTSDFLLSPQPSALSTTQHLGLGTSDFLLSTAFYIGASSGLALLTKGTAYPFIVPLLAWYVVVLFWRNLLSNPISTQKIAGHNRSYITLLRIIPLKSLLVVGGMIIMLNAGHWLRNISVYGTPLTAPDHTAFYANEMLSPVVLISNLTRNVALHIFIPDQVNSIVDISGGIMQAITSIHAGLGLGISDPRTTFPLDTFKLPPIWDLFNEDRAGNPLHLGLLGLALVLLPVVYKNLIPQSPLDLTPQPPLLKARGSQIIFYLFALLSSFVLFSLLLKWQQWGTRLQLPFFVLSAPFIAVVLTAVMWRWLNFLIGLLLLVVALFIAMNGVPRALFASTDSHPLALSFYIGTENINHESVLVQPRSEQYFNSRFEWYPPSAETAQAMKKLGCESVGFISGENGWLYPIIMLLKTEIPGLYMQHVNVENATAVLAQYPPFVDFVPCAIIEIRGQQGDLPEHIMSDGKRYQQEFRNGLYSIYLPEK